MISLAVSSYGLTNKQLLQLYKNGAIADLKASEQRQTDIQLLQQALNQLVINEFSAQRNTIARYDALIAQQVDKPIKSKDKKKK